MNEKMKKLWDKMEAALARAKAFMADGDNKDVSKATAEMETYESLQKEYDIEEKLYLAEKETVTDNVIVKASDTKTLDGYETLKKFARGQALTEDEQKSITIDKALITGDNATSGENLLIPEDVRLEITELRKSFASAKELVTVIPTKSLKGSFNFEKGTPSGLTDFDDGDELSKEENIAFEKKSFSIGFHGKLIPVSNILASLEKSSLMHYVKRFFSKNAVITENKKIFTKLADGKTAVSVTGLDGIETEIIKLDPSVLRDAVIVTNQTGFAGMQKEKDAVGQPMLTSSIADPLTKEFKNIPIKYFSDSDLPNVSGKAPIFLGSLKAGCYFVDLLGLQFAYSAHAGFSKNQTLMKVIEGFDVIQADKDAYKYLTFTPVKSKTVNTKSETADTSGEASGT